MLFAFEVFNTDKLLKDYIATRASEGFFPGVGHEGTFQNFSRGVQMW